jgi:hypothetical protein
MYVYVFAGTERLRGFTVEREGKNLPEAHGPWVLTNRLDMADGDDDRPMVRTRECLDDIEMHGFHILNGHKRMTDTLEA